MINLMQGDCLEMMKNIPDGSVDLTVTSPPYGTTACKWDFVIPFEPMWEQLKRITKDNGAMLLFGGEPFSSLLRTSNLKGYKYDLVWKKSKCGSALTAKFKPLTKHENICVFERKGKKTVYKPQMEVGKPYKRTGTKYKVNNHGYGVKSVEVNNEGTRHPSCILDFPQKWRRQDQVHPTQKPVALMEYLIRTYTNPSETVLDFTMGSGTTGVAAKNLNRSFIGIELDEKYFKIAQERIEGANPLNKFME